MLPSALSSPSPQNKTRVPASQVSTERRHATSCATRFRRREAITCPCSTSRALAKVRLGVSAPANSRPPLPPTSSPHTVIARDVHNKEKPPPTAICSQIQLASPFARLAAPIEHGNDTQRTTWLAHSPRRRHEPQCWPLPNPRAHISAGGNCRWQAAGGLTSLPRLKDTTIINARAAKRAIAPPSAVAPLIVESVSWSLEEEEENIYRKNSETSCRCLSDSALTG